MPYPPMLTKSIRSMTAATTLASSPNEDLWNSSVHCSYYSLLQMMIHVLTDIKHKSVNVADLTKNSNSHIVIRDAVATEIGSSSERLSFLTGFDYLKRMKEAGHRLCVLTASPHITLDPCLERLGVFDMFENVWSCDDFNTTKADPEIYHMVAEKLGVEISDIVFFDDNINAIQTAKTAGTYTVGIFDETGKGFIKEMKETADLYFETLKNAEEVL